MDVRPHRQGFKKLLYHQGSEFKKIQVIQDHTMSPAIKNQQKSSFGYQLESVWRLNSACVLEIKKTLFVFTWFLHCNVYFSREETAKIIHYTMIIKIYAPNKWLHKGAMEALLVEGHTEQQKIEPLQ